MRYKEVLNEIRGQYEGGVFPLNRVECAKSSGKTIMILRLFVVKLLLFKAI